MINILDVLDNILVSHTMRFQKSALERLLKKKFNVTKKLYDAKKITWEGGIKLGSNIAIHFSLLFNLKVYLMAQRDFMGH